mgnify:CR=1 FL=1
MIAAINGDTIVQEFTNFSYNVASPPIDFFLAYEFNSYCGTILYEMDGGNTTYLTLS